MPVRNRSLRNKGQLALLTSIGREIARKERELATLKDTRDKLD